MKELELKKGDRIYKIKGDYISEVAIIEYLSPVKIIAKLGNFKFPVTEDQIGVVWYLETPALHERYLKQRLIKTIRGCRYEAMSVESLQMIADIIKIHQPKQG